MRQSARLLLPLINMHEADCFLALPAQALLASSNLAHFGELLDATLCVLAPAQVVDYCRRSTQFELLGRIVNLSFASIDDLVLDYDFEVVSSLAYVQGIAACGDAATTICFVFLQPNLVLAEGSLRSVARHFLNGHTVLTAPYPQVFRDDFARALVEEKNVGLKKPAIARAIDACRRGKSLGDVLSAEMHSAAMRERVVWSFDEEKLRKLVSLQSRLVGLKPSELPREMSGFRDVAFAQAMCPKNSPIELAQAEFFGVELTQPGSAAKGIPHDLSQSMKWKLEYYLWAVRRFEFGHGPLPAGPFHELFASGRERTPTSSSVRGSETAAPDSSIVQKLPAQEIAPPIPAKSVSRRLVDGLRNLIFGRAPLVGPLHPEWLTYRHVAGLLRADRGLRVGYVGDEVAVLGRALSGQRWSGVELLDSAAHTLARPETNSLDFVVIELSATTVDVWGRLVAETLPAVKSGGQIAVFYRVSGQLSVRRLGKLLVQGSMGCDTARMKNINLWIITADRLSVWIQQGISISMDLLRKRTVFGVSSGLFLFSLLAGLTAVHNLLKSKGEEADATEAAGCATILISV